MDRKTIRGALRHVCAAAAVMGLAACSSVPTAGEGLPQVDLAQALAQARAAQDSGDTSQAASLLEQAARAHPGAKEPWLRQAQMHLEARRYGQAIVAAQEVLQRDIADTTAHSIMAVAGLRSSALALGHLRERNAVQGSAREEAQSLAQIIRDAVGEPLLVAPQPSPQAESPPQRPPTAVNRRRDSVASPVSRPIRPPEEVPARPATAGGRNPFSALQ
jgi:tetratricopeptide (TPR) repeat protein